MDNQTIGEIRIFSGSFAPEGWAFCDGQILNITEYQALFNVIGTSYGGNGKDTFALPDLSARVPVGAGQGPGLTNRKIGDTGGEAYVQLNSKTMPSHSHQASGTLQAYYDSVVGGNSDNPSGKCLTSCDIFGDWHKNYSPELPNQTMAEDSVDVQLQNTGNSQGHFNIQPILGLTFIIATGK